MTCPQCQQAMTGRICTACGYVAPEAREFARRVWAEIEASSARARLLKPVVDRWFTGGTGIVPPEASGP